ncbi:hypothetical protein FACS1894188_00030 [Clostridia bacterium]|nr:hypothetical protein FACS1894188_00030 [Clostridia bacterium]
MIDIGLDEKEMHLIKNALLAAKVEKAVVFGSRAKGDFRKNSDIDIAVFGAKGDEAAHAAEELELLPLPYMFDVQNFETIKNNELREHILRVGIELK